MRIVVLHNDVSADISPSDLDVLNQRDAVRDGRCANSATRPRRGSCTLDLSGTKQQLEARRPDVVFNLVESLAGTDRLMAAGPLLLDALRIPYTGVPTRALLITNGKLTTKQAPARRPACRRPRGSPAGRPAGTVCRGPTPADPRPTLATDDGATGSADHQGDLGTRLVPHGRPGHRLAGERMPNWRNCCGRGKHATGQPHFAEPFWTGASSICRCWPPRPALKCCRQPRSTSAPFRPTNRGSSVTRRSGTKRPLSIHHTPRRFDFPATDAGWWRN